MTWKRLESEDPDRLTYCDQPRWWVGLPLVVLGSAMVLGTAQAIIAGRTHIGGSWGKGLIVSLLALLVGATLLCGRELIFDRAGGRVFRSWRWLFLRGSTTGELAAFRSVQWRFEYQNRSRSYPVELKGTDDVVFLLSEELTWLDASKLAQEVAAFLNLPIVALDTELLTEGTPAAELDAARKRQGESTGVLPRNRPMRQVGSGSPDRLTYRQGFEPFLKLFGLMMLALGLAFLAAQCAGIDLFKARGARGGSSVDAGTVGSVVTALAMIPLLGRRGIAIDRNDLSVKTWWGLLIPFRSRREDLRLFNAVRLARRVKDMPQAPPAVVHAVSLVGPSGAEFPLYESLSDEHARTLGSEVAAFLGWRLETDR